MSAGPALRHATAIVVATTGLLFVGPSGSGKSALAHACLADARRRGLLARLVGDDQVFLSVANGRVLAQGPDSIAGQMELRGTGIAAVPFLQMAEMHCVIAASPTAAMARLPDEDTRLELFPGVSLPLVPLALEAPEPLATLARFVSFLGLSG